MLLEYVLKRSHMQTKSIAILTNNAGNILNCSGFPSARINLSPFTKDFRGGEQVKRVYRLIFDSPSFEWGIYIKIEKKYVN